MAVSIVQEAGTRGATGGSRQDSLSGAGTTQGGVAGSDRTTPAGMALRPWHASAEKTACPAAGAGSRSGSTGEEGRLLEQQPEETGTAGTGVVAPAGVRAKIARMSPGFAQQLADPGRTALAAATHCSLVNVRRAGGVTPFRSAQASFWSVVWQQQ